MGDSGDRFDGIGTIVKIENDCLHIKRADGQTGWGYNSSWNFDKKYSKYLQKIESNEITGLQKKHVKYLVVSDALEDGVEEFNKLTQVSARIHQLSLGAGMGEEDLFSIYEVSSKRVVKAKSLIQIDGLE